MIDHVVLNVRDIEASKKFYRAALAPLGFRLVKEYGGGAGFSAGPRAEIWLQQRAPEPRGAHVAFLAGTPSLVDAFYEAAIQAGGKDHGAPGPRTMYHPHYYGAFVLDPDGNNIEAVCHEEMPKKK